MPTTQIAELHLIAPILRKIADDPNVMNIARESARHLLQSKTVPPIQPHAGEGTSGDRQASAGNSREQQIVHNSDVRFSEPWLQSGV